MQTLSKSSQPEYIYIYINLQSISCVSSIFYASIDLKYFCKIYNTSRYYSRPYTTTYMRYEYDTPFDILRQVQGWPYAKNVLSILITERLNTSVFNLIEIYFCCFCLTCVILLLIVALILIEHNKCLLKNII